MQAQAIDYCRNTKTFPTERIVFPVDEDVNIFKTKEKGNDNLLLSALQF